MPLISGSDGAIAASGTARHFGAALDLGERVVLLLLYLWFLSRLGPSVSSQPYNMLVMAAESFTMVMVLIRRPGSIATSSYAWSVAFVGTCLPLLVMPLNSPLVPVWAAGFLMLYGLLISFAAKLSLRRSFGVVAAHRGVRRGGAYKIVRHPMYLGYCFTNLGTLLINPSLWNLGIYSITFIATLLRISEEEKMLCQDEAYRAYVTDVRFRLFPGLY